MDTLTATSRRGSSLPEGNVEAIKYDLHTECVEYTHYLHVPLNRHIDPPWTPSPPHVWDRVRAKVRVRFRVKGRDAWVSVRVASVPNPNRTITLTLTLTLALALTLTPLEDGDGRERERWRRSSLRSQRKETAWSIPTLSKPTDSVLSVPIAQAVETPHRRVGWA